MATGSACFRPSGAASVTEAEIARAVAALSRPAPEPSPFRCAAGRALEALARKARVHVKGVEIIALRNAVAPERYLRNFAGFSFEDQIRLLESRAALLGLGGLGGLALELLTRSGTGRIRAADGDVFEESNLNRQILSSPESLGQSKAEAAAVRAASLNPACEIEAWRRFVDRESVTAFVQDSQVVIDALGGLPMRLELAEAAAAARIPLVTAAVAGQTGWVAVVAPGAASPAGLMASAKGQSAEIVSGTPAPAVGAAAAIMAGAALDVLRGRRPALWGKMLLFDLADAAFETVLL
ncbi:MAG: ThiF family adenylyltransferase [Desulfovibrionaceae bacterium]|nr:ThiF family adenylyltransferase [Desulfovibrionaceae bacterium]MBF0513138.1 ThiF family adenylyltransferase [Desulfovibrionaceae bacterium]